MSIAGGYVAAARAARSLVAGAALVSLGLVSAGPVAAPALNPRVSAQAYTLTASPALLTASPALLNVPLNMLNMALSVPAWEVQAMNRLADAMIGTGSWQVWGPTNVFGFDEWDPPKLAGVFDMMMPVQPFSSVLGDQINRWAKANFPMNAGCAATSGACPDFWTAARGYLTVPASQLLTGYQFPVVTNPFTLQATPWSGQYVKLEPGAAFASLWNYLSGDPQNVQTVPIGDYFTVPLKLAGSIFNAYYPFVQNSEWFNPKTPFAWAFRPLAPLTCPSCGTEPYDNTWLENYPPGPAATVGAVAQAVTTDRVEPAASVRVAEPAPAPDPLPTPVPPAVGDTGDSPASVLPEVPAVLPEVPVVLPEAPVSRPALDAADDTAQLRHRGAPSGDRSSADKSGPNRTHDKARGRSGQSDAA